MQRRTRPEGEGIVSSRRERVGTGQRFGMLRRAMDLPDVARLLDYPADSWRALARRLRDLGLTPARVAPIVAAVAGLHPVMRAPVRGHHLRRVREPVGFAMRALLFSDPVTEDEARAVFGAELDPLLRTGFLVRRGEGVVSPFVLSLFNDLFILSDELSAGGDGVMGFGDGTIELCRAVFPEKRKRSALDLGCGAGTCGLLLAKVVDRVVATDINPRALVLARVNAQLGGVENIEFREADSFGKSTGETFDLIACQPPFVAKAAGSEAAAFLDGGARGDELALQILSQVGAHLTRSGRAVFRVDWPQDGTPIEQRLRSAAGPRLDVLVLAAPEVGPDEHAAGYGAGLFPQLGAPYEEEVSRRLAHLERAGIRGLLPSIVVLQRAAGRSPSTDVVKVSPLSHAPVTSGRIDRLFAARALLGEGVSLLTAKLRVPEGTVFAEEQVGPGSDVASKIIARFVESALMPPMEIDPEMLFLTTFVHESPDVRAGLARFAEETGMEPDEARESGLPKIREALLGGLLEVAA